MGSGCTSRGGSSAVLFQKNTPDTQVEYTGPAIPALGICTGDLLSEVEAIVLQKIIDYSTGVGIHLVDIDLTQCDLFIDQITCCGTGCDDLPCLMDIVFKSLCILYEDIKDLQEAIDEMNGPYNVACLSGLGANPKLNEIIQELILEFCALVDRVGTLETLVASITANLSTNIGNFMNSAISGCQTGSLVKSGTGASFTVAFKGFNPVGAIIMYGGSIAGIFDGTGLGVSPGPACGWALCNGNNSTVDMRGYKPIGVNDGSMGSGSQNNEVNNSINPGQNYSLNAHGGEIRHTLTPTESAIAPHTHPVTDPGHDHFMRFKDRTSNFNTNGGTNHYVDFTGPVGSVSNDFTGWIGSGGAGSNTSNGANIAAKIGMSAAGISIGASTTPSTPTGAHENRDPYRSLYFIQRVA